MTRRDTARTAAVAAEGQTHMPAEWRNAEAENATANRARRTTPDEMRSATPLFVTAAVSYEDIARRSGPIAAAAAREREVAAAAAEREREAANTALQAAITRRDTTRAAAVAADGQTHMPAEWRNAETQNGAANRARTTTPDEIRAATELFVAAANSYDDIARRSGAIATAARNDANRDFQAALARADNARRAAVAVDGQTQFPADWTRAENQNTAGRNAPRDTVAQTRAAATQLNTAADGFDSIAERGSVAFARATEEANAALQAAMARRDATRQAAVSVNAQGYFPADWRNAETQNGAANRARRTTPDETRAATALFVAVADVYDDLARRSAPMFAADTSEATNALQAAIARATQARQRAENTDAAANLPRDWANLETRHRNAENARRETIAEMRNAANLFAGVADGFDDIVSRNVALAEQSENAAVAARDNAERERLVAIEVRANLAIPDDFGRADAVFQQANATFGARNFAAAVTQYNQSATQFAAASRETERRRILAEATVEQARQRSEESTTFAITTGLALEDE